VRALRNSKPRSGRHNSDLASVSAYQSMRVALLDVVADSVFGQRMNVHVRRRERLRLKRTHAASHLICSECLKSDQYQPGEFVNVCAS
jgi:hypothetical protein